MMHGRTSKALGTVETSNHSYQTKAAVRAIPSKVNYTFLRMCLYNCSPDPAAFVT